MPTIGQHEYPLTTVADAIEKAKRISAQFKGQPFDRTSLAAALNYKSARTGAFNQLLADLRRFGVIDGRGDMLQATSLAQRLAIPTSSEEFSQAVYEMITRIPLFKLLYEHSEGKAPTEEELLATLINLTKADRAAVQAVVTRIRNNFASGLSRIGSFRPATTSASPAAESSGGVLPLSRSRDFRGLGEPENEVIPTNVIEVRAGEVRLKYPMTRTGLKLMRLNFEGGGFWEILEEEVSKSERPTEAGDTPNGA